MSLTQAPTIQLGFFCLFFYTMRLRSRSLQFYCLTYVLHFFKVVIIFSEAGEVNISLVVSVRVKTDLMI